MKAIYLLEGEKYGTGSSAPGKKEYRCFSFMGGPGAPHDYQESFEKYANERPVIFYDQLGCGNSDMPSDTALWTVGRFVDELKIVRSTLKLDKVHLLGQSWGTMLAVEYLIRKNPGGVASLTLSAPYLNTQMWEKDQAMWISKLPEDIQQTITNCEIAGNFDSLGYLNAMNVFYQNHVCRMDPWPDCLNRALKKMGIEVYHAMWGPSEFNYFMQKNEGINNEIKTADVPYSIQQVDRQNRRKGLLHYYLRKLSN